MAARRGRDQQRALEHLNQAMALQRSAEALLEMNQPHAAHLLACHAGISAGDAITVSKTGETHGGDHRRAGNTLLEADQTLAELARRLATLGEEKNTLAYKPVTRNVPRHEAAVRDSRSLVEEACDQLGVAIPARPLGGELQTLAELRAAVVRSIKDRNLDPQQDPWETLLILLETLNSVLGNKDLEEFAEAVRRRPS